MHVTEQVAGCTGEEGPADELWEAINELKVERIDHGVSCLQDPELMKLLKQTRMPLTVCPCSNYKVSHKLCCTQHGCGQA